MRMYALLDCSCGFMPCSAENRFLSCLGRMFICYIVAFMHRLVECWFRLGNLIIIVRFGTGLSLFKMIVCIRFFIILCSMDFSYYFCHRIS